VHLFFRTSPRASFETAELFAAGDRYVARWVYRWIDERGMPGHVRGIDRFRARRPSGREAGARQGLGRTVRGGHALHAVSMRWRPLCADAWRAACAPGSPAQGAPGRAPSRAPDTSADRDAPGTSYSRKRPFSWSSLPSR
jgi:hypothetical protein